jgi:hypothetical protein
VKKNSTVTKTIAVDPELSANDFTEYAFAKLDQSVVVEASTANDFVFKTTGAADFFYGDSKLLDFEYFRFFHF